MTLEGFLIVGAIIFGIGLYGAMVKRNVITVLMSLELMFNGVNITAVALSRSVLPARLTEASGGEAADLSAVVQLVLTGQVFAVFIITIAAAEIALALAIVIAVYRSRETIFVTDATQMRH